MSLWGIPQFDHRSDSTTTELDRCHAVENCELLLLWNSRSLHHNSRNRPSLRPWNWIYSILKEAKKIKSCNLRHVIELLTGPGFEKKRNKSDTSYWDRQKSFNIFLPWWQTLRTHQCLIYWVSVPYCTCKRSVHFFSGKVLLNVSYRISINFTTCISDVHAIMHA